MLSCKFAIFLVIFIQLNSVSPTTKILPRAKVENLRGSPSSTTSITLQWNVSRSLHEDSTFLVRYGFHRSDVTSLIPTNSRNRSFTMHKLEPHSYYRFQVAIQEQGRTGIYSRAIVVALDINTYIVKAQLPSEMKATFQKAMYEVLPLSFLSSLLLNSTHIDHSSSMTETFYEIYFDIGINMTSQQLTDMFARNHARVHTSYVRNVEVYPPRFCRSGRNSCHRNAKCTEVYGTYSCECKNGFVEMNQRTHHFPGRNCSQNTGEPGDMQLSVVNPTTVRLKFRAPRQRLGTISFYELQHATISGDPPSGIEILEIKRGGAYLEKYVEDLTPNGLHKFRTRAVTRIARGIWTDWKQIRTASSLFSVQFDIVLPSNMQNYAKVQKKAHAEIEKKVAEALKISRTVSLSDFQVIRSDLNANRTVRVQGLLYSKSMRKVELFRIQNAAKGRLRSRFRTQYGNLEPEPIELKDYDECANNLDDCEGTTCINVPGSFNCECPSGQVDVGLDFNLLAGRKCIIFDAPLSFKISLLNPKTAKLSWKISSQMRRPQLLFWFVVQYKLASDETAAELRVELGKGNFTNEDYVSSTTVSNLVMASVYQFRVAVANVDKTGVFTTWKNVETSNLIFHAKLNLTMVIYSPNFLIENHILTSNTAGQVRKVIDSALVKVSQYTATGNVTFGPGIRGRTYAYADLFFKKEGNMQSMQIQEAFKHSGITDNLLGIDFDAVNVTDFNECNSTWNDCSEHAICIDEFPGYRCACEDEYVDFSSQESRAPGRFCIHPDNITTPEPTTTTEATTTTSAPLRFPEVALSGDAISPDRIRVTWNRKSKSDQHSSAGLNYVIRYGVKGLSDKDSTTAASTTLSIDISNLHRGMIYEIQAAERWKQNVEPHTLFSFPIEVRTDPKAYRIYVQLPNVPTTSSILSDSPDPQKRRLQTFMSDYFSQIFGHPDVINQHKNLRFGSVGDISFSKHPDRGVIASSILYLSKKSKATINMLGQAFLTGEPLVSKPITISYMYIGDLDECSAETLNDCSPTSVCSNKGGSFDCECNTGFVDMGPAYFLLPGRLCTSANPPSTTSKLLSTTSRFNAKPTRKTKNYASTSTVLSRTTPPMLAIQPTNMIGLLSGECNKGQKMIESVCQDVDTYLGRIEVLKESGNNVSAANLLGEGKESLQDAIEVALDFAFSEIETLNGFFKCKIQDLTMVNETIQAMFVIIMNSQNLRKKRQIQFIVEDVQIDADFIKKALLDYLNDKYPVGFVQPANGAAVVFGNENIIISDIDECSARSLHDCDVNHADCLNTMGGFECQCLDGTNDVSSDVTIRPGRRCRDQCNPSPCLNGATCISQQRVGLPICKCTDGFEGILCAQVLETESNLVVVALSCLAGVLFLFLVCFVVTYRVHRMNKRKKLKQANKSLPQPPQNEAYSSANSEFTNSLAGVIEPEPAVDNSPQMGNEIDATNKTFSPPPIPARTTSVQSGGMQTLSLNKSEPQSPLPIPSSPPEFDAPPSPLLPVLPPILAFLNPELPPNLQHRTSSQTRSSQDIFNNPPRIPSFSSHQPGPTAIPLGPMRPSVPPPQVPQYPLEPPAPQKPKKKSRKGKVGKSAAIRGRIRRHSDSS